MKLKRTWRRSWQHPPIFKFNSMRRTVILVVPHRRAENANVQQVIPMKLPRSPRLPRSPVSSRVPTGKKHVGPVVLLRCVTKHGNIPPSNLIYRHRNRHLLHWEWFNKRESEREDCKHDHYRNCAHVPYLLICTCTRLAILLFSFSFRVCVFLYFVIIIFFFFFFAKMNTYIYPNDKKTQMEHLRVRINEMSSAVSFRMPSHQTNK